MNKDVKRFKRSLGNEFSSTALPKQSCIEKHRNIFPSPLIECNRSINLKTTSTHNSAKDTCGKRESCSFFENSPDANSTFRRFSIRQRSKTKFVNKLSVGESDPTSTTNVCSIGRNLTPVFPVSSIPITTVQPTDDDDDDLPATQPVSAFILSTVVAYVEVRSGGNDISKSVEIQIIQLGATVSKTFSNSVTHVVFREGKLSTYQKAVKRNLPLVSVLWIDACKNEIAHVSEKLYVPFDLERYISPNPVKRIRMPRAYQPDSTREIKERYNKILRKIKKKEILSRATEVENNFPLIENIKPKEKVSDYGSSSDSPEVASARALRFLAGDIDPKYEKYIKGTNSSPKKINLNWEPIPLSARLMRNILSPLHPSARSSDNNSNKLTPVKPQDSVEAALEILFNTPKLNKKTVIPSSEITPCVPSSPTNCTEIITHSLFRDGEDMPENPLESKNRPSVTHVKHGSIHNVLGLQTTPVNHPTSDRSKLVNNWMDLKSSGSAIKTITSKQLNKTSKIITSTQKKRMLFNIPQLDDSPKLVPIMESDDDVNANQYYTQTRKANIPSQKSDMELTNCISTKITQITSPSSKSRRCSLRLSQITDRALSRRSSHLFKPSETTKPKSSLTQVHPPTPTIVCTSLQKEELEQLKFAILQLGVFKLESKVSNNTTHVVCNESLSRTVNLLKGIARGCWIVSAKWILSSLQAKKWLDEEKFEATQFSSSVRQCRVEKQTFGQFYKLKYFSECGPIFVSRHNTVPSKDLVELLTLCGGHAVKSKKARIVVGQLIKDPNVKCVNEKWILDSITSAELRAVDNYLIVAK